MAIHGLGPAHRVNDLELPGRVVQVIVATDDMRDSHVEIVDDDSQHVGRCAVAAEQYHVVKLFVRKTNVALNDIMDDGFLPFEVPLDERLRRAGGRLGGIAIAPAAVIAHGLAAARCSARIASSSAAVAKQR